MKLLLRYFERLTNFFSVFLLSALLIITFIQVVNRYILIGFSMPWTEELARYLFIWVSLIGAAICTREDSHIEIDIVYVSLKPKIRSIISLVINLIFLFLVIFMIWQGLDILKNIRYQKAATLPISMAWVYMAGPVSALIMSIYIVRKIIKFFKF